MKRFISVFVIAAIFLGLAAAVVCEFVGAWEPSTIDITVEIVWEDEENADGMRPESVEVALFKYIAGKEDSSVGTVELNDGNNWLGKFENLETGQVISYYANQNNLPMGYSEGYHITYDKNNNETHKFTNTRSALKGEPDTIDIPVQVVWNDDSNEDEKWVRPEGHSVSLMKDGEVSQFIEVFAYDEWKGTFTNVPKYEDGEEIEYTIGTNTPRSYTAEVTGSAEEGFTVTYTYAPGENDELIELKAQIDWDDDNDRDGYRPENLAVQLTGTCSSGQEYDRIIKTSSTSSWQGTTKAYKYDAEGNAITYSVDTDWINVPHYTVSATGNQNDGFVITMTHAPETINVTATIVWDDEENTDGIRPDSVEVELCTYDEKQEEVPTGKTATLNASNDWTYTFKALPQYQNGESISYYVNQNDLPETYDSYYDQTSDNDGNETFTFTNTQNTVDVTAAIVWVDENNADGIRPESVEVELCTYDYGKQEEVPTGKKATLNASNDWTYTFKALPQYQNGESISYYVNQNDLPETYDSDYDQTFDNDGNETFTFTNTHTPEETSATAKVVWDDAADQDGKRPESLNVTLSNGTEVTLNADDNWSATVEKLPKYENGKEIKYTWNIDDVPEGYELTSNTTSGTVTTLTITHTPEEIFCTIKIIWDDANNQDGLRPQNITYALLKDGAETGQTITLDDNNGWEHTFENLERYKNGKEIKYSLTTNGDEVDLTANGTTTITNTHTPETIDATAKVEWADADNQDGKRPESLNVTLSNGTEVTLNADDNWSATVNNLPKYAKGQEIKYTWTLDELPEGYLLTNTAKDGTVTTLTITHIPEKIDVTAKVEWVDENDQDGLRPGSVAVQLLANGEKTGTTVTLNQSNNWTGQIENLPKYRDKGIQIMYTVQQSDTPTGYTESVTNGTDNTFTITNTHTPETIDVIAFIAWVDGKNADKKRPAPSTVTLYADGVFTANSSTFEKSSDDTIWKYTFSGVAKYKKGKEITYTAKQQGAPEGYVEVLGVPTDDASWIVIGNYIPVDITAQIAWDDKNNQDKLRPESVTVKLFKNGQGTDESATLNADNDWKYTFAALPKYADYDSDAETKYTIKQDNIDGYTSKMSGDAASGFTITNTHTPAPTASTPSSSSSSSTTTTSESSAPDGDSSSPPRDDSSSSPAPAENAETSSLPATATSDLPNRPHTGDSTNLLPLSTIAVFSIGSLLACVALVRKKSN